MIRIHLQAARSRLLLPVLLLGLGGLLVSALGLAYLLQEEHPALPPELAVASQPTHPELDPLPEPEAAAKEPDRQVAQSPAPAVVPETKASALPPAAEAKPKVRENAKAPQLEETRPPQRPAPAKVQAQAPALPPAGPLCLRILQLHERLPSVVRCSSLSGSAGGEYTIEGTVPSKDFPQLIALLDELPRQPVVPALSGGMAGKKEGDYAFNLHGQFPATAQSAPIPLETTAAAGLFTQAAALARKSRLDSVRVGAPQFTPTGKGVVQQRQKLWATGSYQQLKSFVETLVRQQPQLRLEEVMLVPLYKGEAQWKQAQFYAVLSTAVRAAR